MILIKKLFDSKGRIKTALLISFLIFIVIISVFVFAKDDSVKNLVPQEKLGKVHKGLLDVKKDENAQVLIKVKEGSKDKVKNEIIRGESKQSLDGNLLFVNTNGGEISNLILDDDVVEVWPDLQTRSFLDSSAGQINAPYLWNFGFNGSDVRIAILDTGVDADHEMLSGRVVLQEDFTGSGNFDDSFGHGTHVAGIAAGNGQYKGIGYGAEILNGKVLDDNGYGQLSWLINGIDWAIANDADIISLSLGAVYDGSPEEQLSSPEVLKVEEAINKGIIVIIASGNCGNGGCGSFDSVTSPGIAKDAITVGAVDDNNNWASFSSGDHISDYIKPDMVAPGVNICSSIPDGYACYSGTSMATPHISGAAALLLQKDPALNPLEVKQVFENGALDLGETGKDVKYGYGLIDLSNLDGHVNSEEPPAENYELTIPLFETGKEDKIILNYNNTFEEKKKIKVVFNIEELDYDLEEESEKTIKSGDEKEFTYKWEPRLPGKHLLTIDIYADNELAEHIEEVVNVNPDIVIEDKLAKVTLI